MQQAGYLVLAFFTGRRLRGRCPELLGDAVLADLRRGGLLPEERFFWGLRLGFGFVLAAGGSGASHASSG
jgi:hypothetical protein